MGSSRSRRRRRRREGIEDRVEEKNLVVRKVGDIPALKSVHQLARGVETLAHEGRLLADRHEGVLHQASLVLGRRRDRGHDGATLEVDTGAGGAAKIALAIGAGQLVESRVAHERRGGNDAWTSMSRVAGEKTHAHPAAESVNLL